jgi:hypothetical protein
MNGGDTPRRNAGNMPGEWRRHKHEGNDTEGVGVQRGNERWDTSNMVGVAAVIESKVDNKDCERKVVESEGTSGWKQKEGHVEIRSSYV